VRVIEEYNALVSDLERRLGIIISNSSGYGFDGITRLARIDEDSINITVTTYHYGCGDDVEDYVFKNEWLYYTDAQLIRVGEELLEEEMRARQKEKETREARKREQDLRELERLKEKYE